MKNIFFFDEQTKDFTNPILIPDDKPQDKILTKRFLFTFLLTRYLNDNPSKEKIIDIYENKKLEFENFYLKFRDRTRVISLYINDDKLFDKSELDCSTSNELFSTWLDIDDINQEFELNYKLAKGGENNGGSKQD